MSKTRHVNKELYRNYLQKARENLETAKESLQAGRWNAAVINAVHSGISATDAITVFMVGVRHAGDRHEDALALLQTLNLPKDTLRAKSRQLSRLLSIKNASEYEERLIREKEAIEAVKDAERYFEYVEAILHT
ncbi:MAG: HEPN domain-containing protein [Candidatus Bathyarchaeota archaeon]